MSSLVGERWTLSQPLIVVDPGGAPGEGDDQQPRVRLGLGEGGVVAAGAADDGAAGAAAARRQQVAVAFAIEVGRAGQAADQAVGAIAAVELVGAAAGLDQVVLGAGVDRVVAEAAGEADAPQRLSEPSTRSLSLPGPRSAISQRPGPSAGQETWFATPGGRLQPAPIASPPAALTPKVLGRLVEGDGELVAAGAADDLQAAPAARRGIELDVGRAFRRPFLAAGDGAPLGALAAVGPLAAVDAVAAAAADQPVVAGAAVDHVVAPVADQGVAEGRAFDRLEAEQLVVAVADRRGACAARPRRRRPCRRRRRSRRRRCRRRRRRPSIRS